MKYFISLLCISLMGCSTFNASVDGAQNIVNKTIEATGEGVASITSAIGKDTSDTVTYATNATADGIRKVTTVE